MRNAVTYQTPFCPFYLEEEDGFLIRASWSKHCADTQSTPVLREAVRQLDEYFAGRLQSFSLPLRPQGTPFMLAVWEELQKIPYGKTVSYQFIAKQLHSPKACRAVGNANHRNPVAIIVPCHRVIGTDGTLTGYAGGLGIKEKLLHFESQNVKYN